MWKSRGNRRPVIGGLDSGTSLIELLVCPGPDQTHLVVLYGGLEILLHRLDLIT